MSAKQLNVWAWIYGKNDEEWQFPTPGGEWHRSVHFDTLRELLESLAKAGTAKGTVSKLGIVVHGGAGQLFFHEHGTHTSGSAALYATELRALNDYLEPHGRLIFYSCKAGQSGSGSALLNALSGTYFRDRHVIGFTRTGSPGAKGTDLVPGRLWCSKSDVFLEYCKPAAQRDTSKDSKAHEESLMTEYSIYAKWSYNGSIIKLPLDELPVSTEKKCLVGQKAVLAALSTAGELQAIEYVAVSKRAPGAERLWTRLQEPPYNLSAGTGAGRLTILTEGHLRRIRQTRAAPRSVDIVAFYKKKEMNWYRCASRTCPGHADYWDYCEDFAKGFPNGPLE